MHLLDQTVGRGEDQGFPSSKQLDDTRGLARTAAAVKATTGVAGQRVSIVWLLAGGGGVVLVSGAVFRLRGVGCMVRGGIDCFTLIASLSRGDWRKIRFPC